MKNKNVITLNGQESTEITGLLIQELPPISKPLIRTEIEEIDGRDGDIITALGYSAYNKEATIGLYGDYDIDEIIAFFDSEGTVIFSNEPEKYYNYQIIEQIDFERLVRYRTATVTFHIQPFKYSTEENAKTFQNAGSISGEGSNIVLQDTPLAPFTTFSLNGNTEQEGTPTPSTPVNVERVTGANTITVSDGNNQNQTYEINLGKNLFDKSTITEGSFIDSTGTIGSNANWALSDYIPVEPGATYTYSGLNTSASQTAKGGWYTADKTWISAVSLDDSDTITAPSNAYYYRTSMRLNYNDEDTLQFEKGTEATDYANYFDPIELCQLGDFQDTIVNVNGTWYVRRMVGKYTLDGSESWYLSTRAVKVTWQTLGISNISRNYPRYSVDDIAYMRMGSQTYYPNIQPSTATAEGFALCTEYSDGDLTNSVNALYIYYSGELDSVADVTAYFEANPTPLYYALNESVDEEITNEALIAQLNLINSQAHAYENSTSIVSTCADGNAPFIITAEVFKNTTFTITNSGNIYSRPQLTLTGYGTINLSLNGNQLFVINLGDSTNSITIDAVAMEAYQGTPDTLMNRYVDGDYDNFKLNVGQNTITCNGNFTQLVINNYSRWI